MAFWDEIKPGLSMKDFFVAYTEWKRKYLPPTKMAKKVTFSFEVWVSPDAGELVDAAGVLANEEGVNPSACEVTIEDEEVPADTVLAGAN